MSNTRYPISTVNVVVIQPQGVVRFLRSWQDDKSGNAEAEDTFLEKAKEHLEQNWCDEDAEAYLDDGYVNANYGWTVCLYHSE